ncbi:MAG: MarR family transcriptional regulator [Planctomycetaceae bacterium]|nr:MAG: MarR family transcriptional regulator [Planctomycetaceae bacterium]
MSDREPSHDIDSKIVAALERMTHVFERELWHAAWQFRLSPTQAQILLHLGRLQQGCNIQHLSGRFALRHATLSDSVKALCRRGLLKRQRDAQDGRAVTLTLTAAGKRVVRALSPWMQPIQNQVAAVTPNAKGVVLGFLLELIARCQAEGLVPLVPMCTTCVYFEADRYADPQAPHHCKLLNQPLRLVELRVECPDHQPGLQRTT